MLRVNQSSPLPENEDAKSMKATLTESDRLLRKVQKLDALKALRADWEQYRGATFFDQEYVRSLDQRIRSAETRLRNGL